MAAKQHTIRRNENDHPGGVQGSAASPVISSAATLWKSVHKKQREVLANNFIFCLPNKEGSAPLGWRLLKTKPFATA
jgi:hypothetical protein